MKLSINSELHEMLIKIIKMNIYIYIYRNSGASFLFSFTKYECYVYYLNYLLNPVLCF